MIIITQCDHGPPPPAPPVVPTAVEPKPELADPAPQGASAATPSSARVLDGSRRRQRASSRSSNGRNSKAQSDAAIRGFARGGARSSAPLSPTRWTGCGSRATIFSAVSRPAAGWRSRTLFRRLRLLNYRLVRLLVYERGAFDCHAYAKCKTGSAAKACWRGALEGSWEQSRPLGCSGTPSLALEISP